MKESPKISFVVPAYNEEAYIARTLQAIIAEVKQSQCAAEIIVVNNGSSDQTRHAAESYPGVVVINEPSKGLFHARSAGYHAATGDLIANIDADTIITDGWIETVLRAFAANPRLVAISGPLVYYDLPTHARALVRVFYYGGYLCYILNRYVLRVGSMLQGGNFVVGRDALSKIGGFNPDFAFYGEDTDLARRLSKIGDVEFTFALPAQSSGRRLLKEGVARIGLRYTMNFFWATFLKKPFTETWIDIRDQPHKPTTW